VINGIFHLIVVPLSFMAHLGIITIIICYYVYVRYLHFYTWTNHFSRVYSATDGL
jgi:hypothetical protein